MKIFGINFTTKKELKAVIAKQEIYLEEAREAIEMLEAELADMRKAFPLELGQVVYDVALRNEKGRYTKTKASREHSTITETTVTEKNYFGLVERFIRKDVFFTREAAEAYLESVCQ
jgi:hypothetical protein